MPRAENTDELVELAVQSAEKAGLIRHGDLVVITAGVPVGISGTTNMIRVRQVGGSLLNAIGIGDKKADQLADLTLSAIAEAMNQMCGSIATSMASLLSRPTDIGFPLINSKDRKTFEIPDELCNGTDIVKVTFRLTVEDLIDSELIQLYPISIVKQILKQEDI